MPILLADNTSFVVTSSNYDDLGQKLNIACRYIKSISKQTNFL
jgi:hypothetical protein